MGKNVTPHNPCPICGKPDWCMTVDGKNGPLHYCKRIRDSIVISGGRTYLLQRETAECGVYEEESQNKLGKQKWLEEQKRFNPDNYSNKSAKSAAPSARPQRSSGQTEYINRSEYGQNYLNPTDDPERLNQVYRAFLSCLILEDKHEKMLRDEWGDVYEEVISLHPIKSIPMPDKERFLYGAFFKSPWRKQIMQQLLTMVSAEDIIDIKTNTGVPGFFQLGSGEITFSRLSGMVFPIYNPEGKIIRLRIRGDFPVAKGNLEGNEGNFEYFKDGWYFKGSSEPILVYQPKSKTYRVKLDKSGIPLSDGNKKSKVSGKYMNFSSFREVPDDERKVIGNYYLNGCQSGAYPSLYASPSDDFTVVYFTEGEKKAMITNRLLKAPCVSFPGVSVFRTAFEARCSAMSIVDYCLKKGMRRGVLCYDADKNSNMAVLRQEENCVRWFSEHSIQLSIGSWNAAYGKGLDDILLKDIRPTIHDLKIK